MTTDLPYRRNVGAALFNKEGRVLIARRADLARENQTAWQLPQGGLDEGEDARGAVLRELSEEIGTNQAEIIGEVADWLHYDLPAELIGKALRGKYRGQTQKWFALRFTGRDADIRLDQDPHPEFDAWRWAELSELPGIAVAFRKPIYERLVVEFAAFARPEG